MFTFSDDYLSLWEPGSSIRKAWVTLRQHAACVQDARSELEDAFARAPLLTDLKAQIHGRELSSLPPLVSLLMIKILLRSHCKVLDSLGVFVASANARNVLGLALGARAALEHAALLQFVLDSVPWRDHRSVSSQDLETFLTKLRRVSTGSGFDWEVLGAPGGLRAALESDAWKRPRRERIPVMEELTKALDRAMASRGLVQHPDQNRLWYAMLCDTVHPSWGGDIAYPRAAQRSLIEHLDADGKFRFAATIFGAGLADLMDHFRFIDGELRKALPLHVAINAT